MKKIFITGAGGYIGSNLAKFLSKKNIETVCLTTKKKIRIKKLKVARREIEWKLSKRV